MGLRAAFPPAVELEPVWTRAAKRGLLMGRMGQMLGVDPWAAQSAGLFEECGKAVPHGALPDGASEEGMVTISAGLAASQPGHPYLGPQALLQAADEALYLAKRMGRDRLCIAW